MRKLRKISIQEKADLLDSVSKDEQQKLKGGCTLPPYRPGIVTVTTFTGPNSGPGITGVITF